MIKYAYVSSQLANSSTRKERQMLCPGETGGSQLLSLCVCLFRAQGGQMQLPGLIPGPGHSPVRVSPCIPACQEPCPKCRPQRAARLRGCFSPSKPALRMSRSCFIPSLSLLPWQPCCIGRASARNSECYPGFLPGLLSPPCSVHLSPFFFLILEHHCLPLCAGWSTGKGPLRSLSKESHSSFLEGLTIWSFPPFLTLIHSTRIHYPPTPCQVLCRRYRYIGE